jgi:ABC-type Mn2+/Zn2+ transport system permease subunit
LDIDELRGQTLFAAAIAGGVLVGVAIAQVLHWGSVGTLACVAAATIVLVLVRMWYLKRRHV